MKLGILCTMLNGFGRRGYYNSQEVGLGRALARKGHEVTIYKGIARGEQEDTVCLQKGLVIHYIPMKGIGAHGYADCRRIDRNLDGLFCFGDQQIFLPHVYSFCRRNGIRFVPYVGTAHSLHHNFKSRVMDTLFAVGTLRIYKRNPVLAKTEAARKELSRLGVKQTDVVPVGLDEAVLKQDYRLYDRDELRKKHGFSKDDVVICNVSRLSAEKRPLELIDIFMRVRGKKQFRLIIVGNGPLGEELRAKIQACQIQDEVKLYDNVPYEDMWEIYVISDYYLNLNKGEIFGMAIMEAVYYETSVAAIRALGPAVTLSGMRGHKLCDNDRELEEWLLAHYPSREFLKESAEKMARQFTWDRCAAAFENLVRHG